MSCKAAFHSCCDKYSSSHLIKNEVNFIILLCHQFKTQKHEEDIFTNIGFIVGL